MTDSAVPAAAPADLDGHPVDADLLDLIQNEFPLVAEPYATFAEKLGVDHALVIERIQALRDNGKIRQISAIFDTRRLGYVSSLVAAKVTGTQEEIDRAADIFSAHPGVTHNYLREHDFNIWFTVAVPPDSKIGLADTIEVLGQLANVESIRPLPNERFFKIGVDLDVKGGRAANAKKAYRDPETGAASAPSPASITEVDKRAIRALQTDLPATERPFAVLAEQFGFSEEELIERGHQFLSTNQMRRFAAVLAHRKAGFTFNGMGVWKVPAERVEECGLIMGAYRGVSHCYQRPTYPDWPYNLFSMTHGRTKAECEDVLSAISKETGIDDYIVLYSTKEYKKTRVSYFTPETYAWEDVHEAFLTHA
jgi:DNA-binding Lrp family transcriptional regulator